MNVQSKRELNGVFKQCYNTLQQWPVYRVARKQIYRVFKTKLIEFTQRRDTLSPCSSHVIIRPEVPELVLNV